MDLTTNLLNYWKLDGSGANSTGGGTLSNFSGASYGAGKINNGLLLTGNPNFAEHQSNPS